MPAGEARSPQVASLVGPIWYPQEELGEHVDRLAEAADLYLRAGATRGIAHKTVVTVDDLPEWAVGLGGHLPDYDCCRSETWMPGWQWSHWLYLPIFLHVGGHEGRFALETALARAFRNNVVLGPDATQSLREPAGACLPGELRARVQEVVLWRAEALLPKIGLDLARLRL